MSNSTPQPTPDSPPPSPPPHDPQQASRATSPTPPPANAEAEPTEARAGEPAAAETSAAETSAAETSAAETSAAETSSAEMAGGPGEASGPRYKIQVGRTGTAPANFVGPRRAEPRPAEPRPLGPPPAGPESPAEESGAPERREGRRGKDKRSKERRPEEPLVHRPTVPVPSKRQPLPPDLEAELHAAFGEMPIESLVTASPATGQELEADTRLRATVVRLHGDNVFFALSGHHEGVASVRQFATPPEPGAVLDVVVKGYNFEDGLYEVSVPGAAISVSDWSDLDEGAVVDARVTGSNTGGLECLVNNIRGFIPASQVSMYRVEDFSEYVGQRLSCVVTEANPLRRNLVLSHRALLEREREESRRKLLEELEPGQTREGVVRSLRDFGAFVDLGGVDGLIHISQLSWDRVQHPSEVLQEGQKVRVKVERVDPDLGKISLSYRDLLEHPWTNIEQRFPIGVVTKGRVSRLAKFGAFVKLAPGIEGLIHISEISHQPVRHLGSVLSEGQEIDVKILSVDREAQRIALSLKALTAAPEQAAPAEDEPARQPAVARRNEPLKGGTDRNTGGDRFGLKW